MENNADIQVKCPFCGKVTKVQGVTESQYRRICDRREKIQDIVPHLPAETRELLISGMCPECQAGVFD